MSLRELPPRARRIHHGHNNLDVILGTTSACAENTETAWAYPSTWRNYLRVRGEYHAPNHLLLVAWELPPRARRILTER